MHDFVLVKAVDAQPNQVADFRAEHAGEAHIAQWLGKTNDLAFLYRQRIVTNDWIAVDLDQDHVSDVEIAIIEPRPESESFVVAPQRVGRPSLGRQDRARVAGLRDDLSAGLS